MLRTLSFLAFSLILAAFPVAAKPPVEKAVVADTAEKFAVLVERIRSQMAPGQRYEFLSGRDRGIVNQSFDKMAGMLALSGSVDRMSMDDKTRLFNEQEKVNGLLARNADNRLICTHVAPVGSHLPVTQCQTAREVADARKNSRRQMDESGRNTLGLGRGN